MHPLHNVVRLGKLSGRPQQSPGIVHPCLRTDRRGNDLLIGPYIPVRGRDHLSHHRFKLVLPPGAQLVPRRGEALRVSLRRRPQHRRIALGICAVIPVDMCEKQLILLRRERVIPGILAQRLQQRHRRVDAVFTCVYVKVQSAGGKIGEEALRHGRMQRLCALGIRLRVVVRTRFNVRRRFNVRAVRRGLFFLHGVRQKAHRSQSARGKRRGDYPERGLFVIEHLFHALLYAYLTERQRTCRHRPARRAAREQRAGILPAFLEPQRFYRPLIACKLNVSAKENISGPHQRVEPIDRQNQEAQRLPQIIPPRNMRTLMRDDMRALRRVHPRREIDDRPEYAENKRRIDRITQPYSVPGRHGFGHLPPQPQPACQRPYQHARRPGGPDGARYIHPQVQRVDALRRLRSEAP